MREYILHENKVFKASGLHIKTVKRSWPQEFESSIEISKFPQKTRKIKIKIKGKTKLILDPF